MKTKILALALLIGSSFAAQASPINFLTIFSLADVPSGEVMHIYDGDVVNLATHPTNTFSLRLSVDVNNVPGSLLFKLNGDLINTEKIGFSLFAISANNPAAYKPWVPTPGDYELCALLYSGPNGTGTFIGDTCIQFELIFDPNEVGISSFTLVNAETNEDIYDFMPTGFGLPWDDPENSIELDLSQLQFPERINIRANTIPPVVKSVSFGLDGDDYGRLETGAPYALFGDHNGDYKAWQEVLQRDMNGGHFVNVVVENQAGDLFEMSFNITLKYEAISVNNFTLINALTDQPIRDIQPNDVIDLSTLPTNKLNIRVNTTPPIVGGLVINGVTENVAPYSVYGDRSGNYNNWTPTPGNYRIQAVPYSVAQKIPFESSRPKGLRGIANNVSFQVIQGTNKTSFDNSNDFQMLQVYPNPNEGVFTVSFSIEETADVQVEIFDVLGQRIFSEQQLSFSGAYQRQLDLTPFTHGIYFLRLKVGESVSVEKIVTGR